MPEELQETAEQIAAPETQVETTTESASGDSNEPNPDGKPKPEGGFQKKINKLTSRVSEAEREAEFWRKEALRNKPVETKVETPAATAKPKEDDFQTHAEYVEALTDYKVDQKVKTLKAEQNEERAKTYQQTIERSYRERLQEYRVATPDFDEVMADADFEVGKAVLDEIYSHDNGPALAYFLAKNTDEAERLSKLTPMALAREVGRMESRFATAPSTKTAAVSKAPIPPTPVGRSSPTSAKPLDAPDISMEEYRRRRAKENPNFDR